VKRLLLAVAVSLTLCATARAQDASAPAAAQPAASSGALTPADWIKIGGAFGSRGQWQFGFDKSATVGSCAAYAVRAHFTMAGPCRDVFLLAKDKVPAFHLGGAILYSSDHTPGYTARLGFNVGPALSSGLGAAADRIPYLESLTGWRAPQPLAYLGKITTLDYFIGDVGGRFDHGPQLKVDLPLKDLGSLLGIGVPGV
jgi:hypothetical protein